MVHRNCFPPLFTAVFGLQKKDSSPKKANPSPTKQPKSKEDSSSSPTNSTSTLSSALPDDLCRRFSFAEIKVMTKHFSDDRIIGVGGSGSVYKGYNKGDEDLVLAIKRLNRESQLEHTQGFRNEVQLLAQLRHPNLVPLLGFCTDKREMIAVYEYMKNGSLRDYLYGTKKDPLSWKQRLDICIGAAAGLKYLHTGLKHTIIHRNVKTTTILLDEFLEAKISGLGFSRMLNRSGSNASITTTVRGTSGYLDPEYKQHGLWTEKSDVYSFGVVLLEVLCARPEMPVDLRGEQNNLVDWVRNCVQKTELNEIIDPHLVGKIRPKSLEAFVELAVNCLLDQGSERPFRPSMGEVINALFNAKRLQGSNN